MSDGVTLFKRQVQTLIFLELKMKENIMEYLLIPKDKSLLVVESAF